MTVEIIKAIGEEIVMPVVMFALLAYIAYRMTK